MVALRRIAGLGTVLLALALVPAAAEDGPPADWPPYLKEFKLPEGRTWAQYRVRLKDAMPQALIPAGEFTIGASPGDAEADTDEKPAKRVRVSAFWVDLHEVTVTQYQRFCETTDRDMPRQPEWSKPEHPVVMVSWDNAAAYADWVGAKLPTEAQWEKAARGGTTTRFPWGDEWSAAKANGTSERGRATRVGPYPPNAYGLFDVIGNVSEWCRDWYAENWYATMPADDPCNTTAGQYRVARGSSWRTEARYQRVSNRGRGEPAYRDDNLGFRCVDLP